MPELPRLWVADNVTRQLVGLPARPWEVGGWLLGYWSADRRDLVVTHATPPARRGTPFGVWISGDGHRERFDEAWAASEGRITYIGDWHTHPGGPALPSTRDARAMKQISADEDFRAPQPLIAITALPRWRLGRPEPHTRWHLGSRTEPLTALPPHALNELPEAAASVPVWPWPLVAVRR